MSFSRHQVILVVTQKCICALVLCSIFSYTIPGKLSVIKLCWLIPKVITAMTCSRRGLSPGPGVTMSKKESVKVNYESVYESPILFLWGKQGKWGNVTFKPEDSWWDTWSYLVPVWCLLLGATFQEWCVMNFSIKHKIVRIDFFFFFLKLWDKLSQVRATSPSCMPSGGRSELWEVEFPCFECGNGLDDFPRSLTACLVLSKRCRNKIISGSQLLRSRNRLDLLQKLLHREVHLLVRPSTWERPNGPRARVNMARW